MGAENAPGEDQSPAWTGSSVSASRSPLSRPLRVGAGWPDSPSPRGGPPGAGPRPVLSTGGHPAAQRLSHEWGLLSPLVAGRGGMQDYGEALARRFCLHENFTYNIFHTILTDYNCVIGP